LVGGVLAGFFLLTGVLLVGVFHILGCPVAGGGYVFSTSNCVYTGMPLQRYELMLDIWRKEGQYS